LANPDAALESALLDARLRQHHLVTPSATGASAGAGAVVAFLLWHAAGAALMMAWVLALTAALGLRLAVRAGHARGHGDAARGLLRYRLAFLVHGVVWASLPLAIGPALPPTSAGVVLIVLVALVGGSLVSTAFDRRAALLFGVPVLLALAPRLLSANDAGQRGVALALAVFLLFMLLAAGRSAEALVSVVQARLRDAEHSGEAERARRQLADQHHLLTQLMRTTSQGYWFLDVEGNTVDVNDAMCSLLGRTREQVMGRCARDFFAAEDLPVLDRALEARARGEHSSYEVRLQRPDGSLLLCHNNATPLFDVDGGRTGSVGLWTDLSAREATERALRAYELAIHSMVDPISIVDEDLRYRVVNAAWCRMTGLSAQQAIGRTGSEVLGDKLSPERVQTLQECIELQQPRTLRAPVPTPQLSGRLVETRYHPYRDGATGLRCVVLVSRDVTEEANASEALANSAEDLRRTLDATGDAIFASDATHPQQPVRFVNDRLLQMWGLPADKAAVLTPADILDAVRPLLLDPDTELARIDEIIANNLHDECRLTLRDSRVLLRRCTPARGRHGTVRVWTFRDVTVEEQAARKVRDSEAQQRALLDAFPGYIAAIDHNFRYTFVNQRFAALMGRVPAEMVGLWVRDVLGEEGLRRAQDDVEQAMSRGGHRVERYYPPAPGRPALHLEVTHVPGPLQADGSRDCYGFGLDITARKEAEQALIDARDQAERASRSKTQFLAQMSHELRTPLNAIIGFAQLLQTDDQLPLGARERGQLGEIVGGGRHLLALINELLDFGRIESGHLVVEHVPVPLAAMLEECLGLVRALAEERGLRLLPAPDIDVCARLRGDRMRIKQVLLNLLGNAIKYNRPGGEIELACRAEGDQWHIEVRDSGRGLDAAQCARLFQPFERLNAAHSGIEGAGIGLALSRRLVEAMGGSIGVDSQRGVGSRFWIRLPRAKAGSNIEVTRSRPTPLDDDAVARRVLYIEDNAVNILLMEAMLARLPGVQLVTAEHPGDGLLQAARDPPALILLDIQLPDIDGFEVFARLRSEPATRHVPVVAVSADGSSASIDAALATGFAAYLSKPLDLDTLLATVRRLLRAPTAAR
jgi:PAS domain S-box-containing protein